MKIFIVIALFIADFLIEYCKVCSYHVACLIESYETWSSPCPRDAAFAKISNVESSALFFNEYTNFRNQEAEELIACQHRMKKTGI